MTASDLVYPMFAMVLLTFVTLVRLFLMRSQAVRDGTADAVYFKTYREGSEPEAAAQLARNFSNLLEAPTLFYAACLAAIALDHGGALTLGLAWLYVALRVVHTVIHTGSNAMYPRIGAYFTSWAALLGLWTSIVLSAARTS